MPGQLSFIGNKCPAAGFYRIAGKFGGEKVWRIDSF